MSVAFLPNREASPTPQQLRKAYLRHVYEDGFTDGITGKLRPRAAYFENDDAEALAQYRRGLRIGRRERELGRA